MKRVKIINGPNLNLLGSREPSIYGSKSFEVFLEELRTAFPDVEIAYVQSNIEGELVDALQAAAKDGVKGVVLNAAAFSHTSMAIADAVAAIDPPVVEVHISNVFAREAHRHHSYITKYAAGLIVGFGLEGYRLAIDHFLRS